eukprot:6199866-Pleurochrysis_carterae.AAC.1
MSFVRFLVAKRLSRAKVGTMALNCAGPLLHTFLKNVQREGAPRVVEQDLELLRRSPRDVDLVARPADAAMSFRTTQLGSRAIGSGGVVWGNLLGCGHFLGCGYIRGCGYFPGGGGGKVDACGLQPGAPDGELPRCACVCGVRARAERGA